jgi:hypothetical protein
MHATRIGAAALVAVSLLIVGCGSNNTASTPTTATPTSPRPTPAPTPTQSPRTLAFKLNATKGYTAHGTVRVDIKVYGYDMTVTMKGLGPNTRHDLNLVAGSCGSPNDSLRQTFDNATADANGTLTSVSTWQDVYSVPALGRTVVVHGDYPANSSALIACAVMTN